MTRPSASSPSSRRHRLSAQRRAGGGGGRVAEAVAAGGVRPRTYEYRGGRARYRGTVVEPGDGF